MGGDAMLEYSPLFPPLKTFNITTEEYEFILKK